MPWYRHLLWPFALLYGIGVWIRNRLFDSGFLKSKAFDIPLICVGNLETGGTGKSPTVLYCLQLLVQNGRKPALLSRGYGRKTKGFRLVESTDIAANVGDEPLQAKLRFPNVPVVVCENRIIGIERIVADLDADVIVMDDGFQHRWVKPSLSILVTRSSLPFWRNYLLPVGSLREPKSEQNRSDAILVLGEEINIPENDKTIIKATVSASELVQISGPSLSPQDVNNVLLASGIANAHRFESSAVRGFNVLEHFQFGDHHQFSSADFDLLQKKIDSFGGTVDAVVVTEKDAARLANTQLLSKLANTPVFYLKINLSFSSENATKFEKLIVDNGKYVR